MTGGLEVLIDGQIFQEFYSLSNVSLILNDSVAVSRPQENSSLVTFPSGISVTVTDVKGSLSIVFAAPFSFKGQTKGLLGTWNDDQEDDFLTPDGNILPSNATGWQIHFNFGLKCKFIQFGVDLRFVFHFPATDATPRFLSELSRRFLTLPPVLQVGVLTTGSLRNHDDDGNKNVTNLHI